MSSSSTKQRLAKINQATQDTVCGFNREVNRSSDENSLFHNIPPLINYLCLLYYHPQFFDESSDCLDFSGDDSQTITKMNQDYENTIYSSEWVDSEQWKIIELTMKFEKIGLGASIAFGLVNHTHELNTEAMFYKKKGTFTVWNSGYLYKDGRDVSSNAMKTKTGDVVNMILDLANRQIKVIKNDGEWEEIIFKDIHKKNEQTKYKFAFMLLNKWDSITIVSLKKHAPAAKK